jgi:hypothetical protein
MVQSPRRLVSHSNVNRHCFLASLPPRVISIHAVNFIKCSRPRNPAGSRMCLSMEHVAHGVRTLGTTPRLPGAVSSSLIECRDPAHSSPYVTDTRVPYYISLTTLYLVISQSTSGSYATPRFPRHPSPIMACCRLHTKHCINIFTRVLQVDYLIVPVLSGYPLPLIKA